MSSLLVLLFSFSFLFSVPFSLFPLKKISSLFPLVCHNLIFEQIIKKLNIVDNGIKITKFEVWGCDLRVN
jgi:hypothetical protein